MNASALLLRVTLLFGVAAVVDLVSRRASAATRHAMWASVIAASLALPLAVAFAPKIALPILPPSAEARGALQPVAATDPGIERPDPSAADASGARFEGDASELAWLAEEPSAPEPDASAGSSADWAPRFMGRAGSAPEVVVFVWGIGFLSLVLRLAIGRGMLARVARSAIRLEDASWRALLHAEAERVGVRRAVTLLTSDAAGTPMSWGIGRPVILLPSEARAWSGEKRRVVLHHELAHIARGDAVTQLLGSVACALYWFHPGVWWGARRLAVERERACDDRVLLAGTSGEQYAALLIALARVASDRAPARVLSVGMADASEFEGRLVAALDEGRARRASARAWPVLVGAIATSALLLAAVEPSRKEASDLAAPVSRVGAPTSPPRVAGQPSCSTQCRSSDAPADGASGTSASNGAQEAFTVRDSAGVRIVQHNQVTARRAPFEVDGTPVFRIGRDVGGRAFTLPWLGSLLSNGRSAVADFEAGEIVVLSSGGVVESVLGGKGSGRGQLAGIFSLITVGRDTLLVQDATNEKAVLFREGALLAEIPLDPESAENQILGADASGGFYLGVPTSVPLPRELPWFRAQLAHVPRLDSRPDTIAQYDLMSPLTPERFRPFGFAKASRGQVVIGRGDVAELRWLDAQGRLTQIVRWQAPPRVVSDSFMTAYESALLGRAATPDAKARARTRVGALRETVGDALPIFSHFVADSDGNVWIGEYGVDLEHPTAYSVLAPDGRWLGRVEVPARLRILAIGRDYVLTAENERSPGAIVAMYRIERAGPY